MEVCVDIGSRKLTITIKTENTSSQQFASLQSQFSHSLATGFGQVLQPPQWLSLQSFNTVFHWFL